MEDMKFNISLQVSRIEVVVGLFYPFAGGEKNQDAEQQIKSFHVLKIKKEILVWMVVFTIVNLSSTSRSRAAVARRAHNPKVGGSNPPFATEQFLKCKPLLIRGFYI